MSIQTLARVIGVSRASGTAYTVLLMVANHEGDHDGDAYCWPAIDTLARESRCSRRAVIDAIATLEKLGEISVDRNAGPRGTNLYRVSAERGGADSAPVQTGTPDLHPNRKEVGSRSTVGSSSTVTHSLDFDAWWIRYPRKVGKGDARKAYAKALSKTTPERLLDSAVAYASVVAGGEPRFIAHPATWLNAERWEDEAAPKPKEPTYYVAPEPSAADLAGFAAATRAQPWSNREVSA